MGQLQDKVCIVTGGAGSIGLASARRFASEGAKVMLVGQAPGVREIESRDHAQQRRLAATRRAEQREEFAGLDREAHVVYGGEVTEAPGDRLDFE